MLQLDISASRDYAVKYHHIFEVLHLFVIKHHYHTDYDIQILHLSLYSSINLPIYLFIKHLFIKQIIHSSIHLSIYLYPSIHQSIHPSVQLSIYLSIYPSIRLSFLSSHQQFLHIAYLGIYLSIHPSIYPSIHSYRWSSNLDLLYYPMSGIYYLSSLCHLPSNYRLPSTYHLAIILSSSIIYRLPPNYISIIYVSINFHQGRINEVRAILTEG